MMVPEELLQNKGASVEHLTSGDVIYQIGAQPTYYYQLVSGRVRIVNFTEEGREVLHKLVEPGECFGELSLFDKRPHKTFGIADTQISFLKLGMSSFFALIQEYPDLHLKFTKTIAQQLRFKFLISELMSTNQPECMLSQLIDYFFLEQKYICEDCHQLMLTRQQIANMLGLRVETVIRTMKKLEKYSPIKIVKGKVFVN